MRSLVRLLCFVLFQALPVQAQEARLFLQQIPEEELSIGDTLRVEVYAVAHGLALTSASAYLSFDEQVFALVPASFAADGTVQPFVRGPFLPGQVYENSTAGDAEGGNGLTGFQLNYVAVSGTGENRSTGRDKAVLARVDLRVVGYPANGTSSVRLDAAGQRQPLYTTLQAPGVAHRFQTGPELWVEIAGEGLLSLDDRVMTFGERQSIDLEAHAITQKWSSEDITWQAWSADPERLAVEVDGRYLALRAIQDEGQVRVFYRVIWPDGQVDDGDFAVLLNAAVGRLAPVFLQVEEDAGTQHLDLGAFFIDKLAAVNGHWSLQDATGVQAKIDGEELLFAPVADWHGHQVLAVNWCDEAEQCETTTLEIEIAAVNDAPRIVVLAPQAVAVGGVRLGPALSEVASDPDHPLESLQFEVAGDGIVAVTIVDGIIALHGIAEGIGKVRLQVSDPLGAQAATEFEVQVVRLDAGPELAAMSDMVIEVGQSNQVAVGVTDADTPLAELQWSVAVEGPVAVEVIVGNLPLLELRGLAVGEAVVRLQVNDPEGSGAVVALRVRVEEPASDSKPGAEETAQEPVEEVDNSVPGETTTPVDSAV
ncbi:MAG: hypothetical protein HOI20_24565, partial [Gemmatimonadetes bacterium]|nr:hypothetical protein [Gemmatimonadota bacterium]